VDSEERFKSLSELIAEVRKRYWQQRIEHPREKRLVPLVKAVLDDNGMANDPAYHEIVSQICSALASHDHRQLSLFS
jgi:hypothetical protein